MTSSSVPESTVGAKPGRRLIDGATGREPNALKGRERRDALGLDRAGPRVEVPVGRDFDWKALTGHAWFDPGSSADEPDPPWQRSASSRPLQSSRVASDRSDDQRPKLRRQRSRDDGMPEPPI
jgi:hypothetical protein